MMLVWWMQQRGRARSLAYMAQFGALVVNVDGRMRAGIAREREYERAKHPFGAVSHHVIGSEALSGGWMVAYWLWLSHV